MAISPERRNWRGIFIALLVIAAVFSLIIFSIFLLSPGKLLLLLQRLHLQIFMFPVKCFGLFFLSFILQNTKKTNTTWNCPEDEALRLRGVRLTLSDILSKRLQWKPFNGTWHSGRYSFTILMDNGF